jgi:hypothetical protein
MTRDRGTVEAEALSSDGIHVRCPVVSRRFALHKEAN